MRRTLLALGLLIATPASALAQPAAQDPKPKADPAPPQPKAEADPKPIEVSVAGQPLFGTAGSAHVVRGKQIDRFKYTDPHAALAGVPSVTVRGEDGYGLRPNIGIRGTISDRSKKITLMEDGVLFAPAPYSAPAAYYFPLIARMSGIRVIKGPAALSFGPHTVAGAIDLVTAPIPDGHRGFVDLAVGQYLFRKVHVREGVSNDDMGVLVEGLHIGTNGFKELDGGGDTGFLRGEVMLKARRALPRVGEMTSELELKLGWSGEVSNETYLGLTDEDFRATPYRRYAASKLDRMEWNRTQLDLRYRAQLRDVEFLAIVYRHDLHRVWKKVNGFRGAALPDVLRNPTVGTNAIFYGVLTGKLQPSTQDELLMIGPNDRTFVSQGVQLLTTWKPKTGPVKHHIELGLRLHHDSIDRKHSQEAYEVVPDGVVNAGLPVDHTADNFTETFALAGYVLDAAKVGPVTLTTGVRMESIRGLYVDRASAAREGILQQVVLPGGGAFVELPKGFGLFAGVNQGFSPVPPGQLSPVVKPEKSTMYEWGARFQPKLGGKGKPSGRLRAEVVGFFNDYDNLTNLCTFSGGCVDDIDKQTNAGKAHVWGIEAFAESEVRITRAFILPGRLAYTYTNATFQNDFSSSDPIFGEVKKGDQIPYVPEHQFSAAVGLEHERFGVNVAGTYVGKMREKPGQAALDPKTTTDDYFLFDATVSGKPLRWLTLYLSGKNLLNQAYLVSRLPFGARPGAPLWIQAGLKAEW